MISKIILFFLPYSLFIYGTGLKMQQYLQHHYQQYLSNFDGQTLYIAPINFSWFSWWVMGIISYFLILSIIGLVLVIKEQQRVSKCLKA